MSPVHSGIQALIQLARRDGMEMRPVLLRVLTDLYVQEPVHAPAERLRFAELACRLLDRAEIATRAAVAARLADCPSTPPQVAAKLVRDDISVAAAMLRRSPAVSEAELHSVLDDCGIAHAAAIAARENLPASVARRLRKTGTRKAKPALPERNIELTHALARRYLATGAEERTLIATALACCPAAGREDRIGRAGRDFGERLERAALSRRTGEFATLLRDRIGLARDLCRRIVTEPSGEPLAALCRAFDLPFSTVSRILLFLNPAVGGSVREVFELGRRFEAMPVAIARRLAASWGGFSGLRPERAMWTRTPRERNDPRAARTIRCVTPARPARANEL